MSEDEVKGRGKQLKGKTREAAGVFTDDKEMKAKGRMEKTEGKAKEELGKVKRKVTGDRD